MASAPSMSAHALARRRGRAVESAMEATALAAQLDRQDRAGDDVRGRAEQLVAGALDSLGTLGRLDALEDQTRGKLATQLRVIAGALEGIDMDDAS